MRRAISQIAMVFIIVSLAKSQTLTYWYGLTTRRYTIIADRRSLNMCIQCYININKRFLFLLHSTCH